MEGSTSNYLPSQEDEIQPVNDENIFDSAFQEQCELLLNISIDKINSDLNDPRNIDNISFSSNSSAYQMTTMETFNFIATHILYSKYFQYYYFIIAILSCISLFLSYILTCTNTFHLTLEVLIIVALAIEVAIRLLAQKQYFFSSFWNILDVFIISICIWLFYVTKNSCSSDDTIIDNVILILRYITQFIRLGLILRKNKTSGGDEKRKSVNFGRIKRRKNYGTFHRHRSHPSDQDKRRLAGNGGSVVGVGESSEEEIEKIEGIEGEREVILGEDMNMNMNMEDEGYDTLVGYIDPSLDQGYDYTPYANEKYDYYDDSQMARRYDSVSIQNESIISPYSTVAFSQSLGRDYANYLQENNSSININIDSNANLAKMLYHDESVDNDKMNRQISINSVNNEIYQKLIYHNLELNNNNKASYGSLAPLATTMESQNNLNFSTSAGAGANSVTTPQENNSIFSPNSSYRKKTNNGYYPSIVSTSVQTDTSFSITLPPKVGRKPNNMAKTNHSSTFSEIPNRINLLTPILYGSPNDMSVKN